MKNFKTFALQSGSAGNCIYVESGDTRIWVDAGISGKKTDERMARCNLNTDNMDGLLISHNHYDHTNSAGVLCRRFKMPLWITPETEDELKRLGDISQINYFESGSTFKIGDLTVETIPTPHDGVDGNCFIFDSGDRRLGIFTDLGHVFDGLEEAICSLDAVFIESNYDEEMLKNGPYHYELKERVSGEGGHISNVESAGILEVAFKKKLQWACLSHLSQNNNSHETAIETHRKVIPDKYPIYIAPRNRESKLFVTV